MIPAIQRAKEEYETRFPGRTLDELVMRAIEQGAHLVIYPDLFIVASQSTLTDDGWVQDDRHPNTWFITLAATSGSELFWHYQTPATMLARFMRLAPQPLPFVAWQRRNGRIRVYHWERLEKLARKESYGIR